MIQFKCQSCGTSIKVGDEFAGKKGKCPQCKQVVEVPRPKTAESDLDLVPMDSDAPKKAPAPAKPPASAAPKPAPAAIQKKPAPPNAAKSSPPPAARAKKPAPPEDEVVEVVEEVVEEDIEEDVEIVAEAPPRKSPKRLAVDEEDDVEEDVDVVAEDEPRKGRRRPPIDEDEEDEPPRKLKRRSRDEDEDEVDEDEDDRPRKGRKARVEEEVDEEPEEVEEERPKKRKKKSGRRGDWADCPNCGCPGFAEKIRYNWWGGILAPALFSIVECNKCGTHFNGKSGNYYTVGAILYNVIAFTIIFAIFGVAAFIYFSKT